MKRDLNRLAANEFDILIIGGGIYGASLAWLASLENIKVALIEQNDFASGTSSNSQKIIHGGLRYLAKLDFKRIKESIKERKRLMWIAPHLVYPMPCVVPVYGHGFNGKEGMSIGFKIYNFLSRDRNKLPDKNKFIPDCQLLSKEEIISLIPGIDNNNLIAGAKWYDGFCINTERLIISFLKSAYENGAVVANYVFAKKLLIKDRRIQGVEAVDNLKGDNFTISSKAVINCTGTWLNNLPGNIMEESYPLISGINIVTKKIFNHNFAVGIKSKEKGSRYYFVAPWKGKSIVGTEWSFYKDDPADLTIHESECKELINNFNNVYPFAELNLGDVTFTHKGFVFGKSNQNHPSETLNDYKIYDSKNHDIQGLLNVMGVKYTTAVDVAENILEKVNPSYRKKKVLEQPKLSGGNIENLSEFKKKMEKNFGVKIGKNEIIRLVETYGSESEKVLNYAEDYSLDSVLKAEIIFSIKEEMAVSLSDVVLRRTGLGDSEEPHENETDLAADIMATELNWSSEKKKSEKGNLKKHYPEFIKKRRNTEIIN